MPRSRQPGPYARTMTSLLALALVAIVAATLLYTVVRLAVRDGRTDALRRSDRASV